MEWTFRALKCIIFLVKYMPNWGGQLINHCSKVGSMLAQFHSIYLHEIFLRIYGRLRKYSNIRG